MIFVRDFLFDQQVLISPSANPSPKVSIILPTYCRCKEGLLERSIKSVLAQRFTDFELLIMDDGSTDGSADLIERYRAKDPRIIHVRHEQNSGLPGLRVNEGIELARGEYLAFQFDDDVWLENALQDLVSEAQRHPEPVVVVGRAQMNTRLGKASIPPANVELVDLMVNNRFANNSVLFPRHLVNTLGMYDPHIGMRRLTDWDLWLRYYRRVPFVIIDRIVANVYESNVGAIGVTVPWDLSLFRYIHNIPRDHLLTLQSWRDYPVDGLNIGGVEVKGEIRRRLYEDQIVPFYFKHRHQFPNLGSFPATLLPSPRKYFLYTKQSYDVCNDVTITHYDRQAHQRGSFKGYYQPLDEVTSNWVREADLALLMRSVEDKALEISAQAQASGRPLGLYLDDDLFTFHEYGPTFDYLAPGRPLYRNLAELASQADAILVTNDFIARSASVHNPRIIPHNNTVPDEYLPAQPHPRGAPLRIGYAGTGYRIEEFRLLWDAFVRISQEYGEQICFEFWGIDISDLPALASPVVQRPFTFSYLYYLDELKKSGFDIMVSPLLEQPRPRLGKSLIKYYETAVAGALGIFSDSPQYAALLHGVTCLKARNEPESWYQALKDAIEMSSADFDRLRSNCLAHVREEYSASAQIDLHEAALRALEFHGKTRAGRHADGRPRVVYVLHSAHYGGAEIQLWRRLRLMKRYGIQPVVVIPAVLKDTENGRRLKDAMALEGIELEAVEYTCFTEPRSPTEFFSALEHSQIEALLKKHSPVLVHTVTFIPSFGQVCLKMGIPHVATLYAVQDDFAWQGDAPGFVHCSLVQSDCLRYAKRWGELLQTPYVCSRDVAPESAFKLGQRRAFQNYEIDRDNAPVKPLKLVVTGTFQARKQQLETILAAGRLKKEGYKFRLDFYGYTHFFPEYLQQCQMAIQSWDLHDVVAIHEFSEAIEQILEDADILLSLSTYESFPGSIKDAMAAGVFVVATPVGGVAELIINGVSGLLCKGTSVEDLVEGMRRALDLTPEQRRRIAEQARHVARLELHPHRAANDLFRMYNMALDAMAEGKSISASPSISPALPAERHTRARIKAPAGPPVGLMPIGAGVLYTLTPEQPQWNGLDVLFETNSRPTTGQLQLKVFTQSGDLLRTATRDVNNLREAGWLELRFPSIQNAAGQTFNLELKFISASPGALVSLYESSPPKPWLVRALNRILRKAGFRLRGGQLHCQLWYDQD